MMLIRTGSAWQHVIMADHNEVARRALVQVLALRAWQLKHGGQFPKSLDALVPGELPSLPDDPYSGQPFGYVRSHWQEVPSLRYALSPAKGRGHMIGPGDVRPRICSETPAPPRMKHTCPRREAGCSTASALTLTTTVGSPLMTRAIHPNPTTSSLKSRPCQPTPVRAQIRIWVRNHQSRAPYLRARRYHQPAPLRRGRRSEYIRAGQKPALPVIAWGLT